MSIEEKILQRILTAGSLGVKKTDLRREFETAELTILLENLISRGEVFVDKKGAAYYCWHREHYMENLLNSDQKFRLVYSSVKLLEDSINRTSDGLARTVEALACNISNLAKLVVEQGDQRAVSNNPHANIQTHSYKTTTVDEFKKDFDTAISNGSTSIGWVELAKIRNQVCKHLGISSEEFYQQVNELMNLHHERYELSTGGGEGVVVRGLVHGFVRCI